MRPWVTTWAGFLAAATAVVLGSATGVPARAESGFRPLGFTADGTGLLYEEYAGPGESGYAYAAVRRVDLTRPGADVILALVAEDQAMQTLAAARALAMQKAGDVVGDEPAVSVRTLVDQPVFEIDSDPTSVRFALPQRGAPDEPGAVYTLRLSTQALVTDRPCAEATGIPATGFRLDLTELSSGRVQTVDASPALHLLAGACPVDARIDQVLTGEIGDRLAVVVGVRLPGPTWRYVVVGASVD